MTHETYYPSLKFLERGHQVQMLLGENVCFYYNCEAITILKHSFPLTTWESMENWNFMRGTHFQNHIPYITQGEAASL
jgi:hypothetical protein